MPIPMPARIPLPARTPPADTAQLAAAAAGGDERAFRLLVRELYPGAVRTAARILVSRAEAEDAAQAAFIKLWREIARFDPQRGRIEQWFGRMLVNCCIDRKRSLKLVAPLDAAGGRPSDGPDPDEAAQARDVVARVAGAVGTLNVRQRTAIVLFYGEGASMAEIAAVLGTSAKAVEGLLGRARSDLASRLHELRSER